MDGLPDDEDTDMRFWFSSSCCCLLRTEVGVKGSWRGMRGARKAMSFLVLEVEEELLSLEVEMLDATEAWRLEFGEAQRLW